MRLPLCDRCQRQVAEMQIYEDFDTQAKVAIVRCHGAAERTVISYDDMMDASVRIEPGVAFRRREIPA